ncbi:MAG: cobalt ABC transporter ATP-binding protein [Candidatus Altiarchaeales archaeon ex4484_96]|nr:MAG: cobalt ABC transporter ATP-binding protein [Candidatus Altiarchaeales archaeon ex4484_96]
MEYVIEASGLGYTYPDGSLALRDINLRVRRNESVCLIGPNGSGKTTLLLHLNGILRPARGKLRVVGLDVNEKNLKLIRSNVGVVFQNPDDQLFMPSVYEDVAFGPLNAGIKGKELEDKVAKALDVVGLEGYGVKSSNHLSFGEKKRVSIATVLSMGPDILVLDEPTLGLDPWIRGDFMELIDELQRTHTVVIASHDLALSELSDSVYLMGDGQLSDRLDEPGLSQIRDSLR